MRRGRTLLVASLAVVAVAVPSATATAAKPTCPGHPGCKTADDPNKNNPKFQQSQLGNFNQGTEDTCVQVKPGRDKPC